MALKFFSEETKKPTVAEVKEQREAEQETAKKVEELMIERPPEVDITAKKVEFTDKQKQIANMIANSDKSIQSIARSCLLSRKTLYNILLQQNIPSRVTIMRLCKYFGKDWKDYVD